METGAGRPKASSLKTEKKTLQNQLRNNRDGEEIEIVRERQREREAERDREREREREY
jgi:hypothetical protein